MGKLWWLLAAIITAAVMAHYFSDQVAIDNCLEQGGSYQYDAEYCSQTLNYDGDKDFLSHHKSLIALWITSLLALIASLTLKFNPQKKPKKLLLIDNYDSFTFNLMQYFSELGVEVTVKRNDEIGIEEIEALKPDYLVISPGPCTPNEAGISLQAIKHFAGKLPILGVCLGHQAIAQVFGGKVARAKQVVHGKTSKLYHQQQGLFKELPSPFKVTRYHSLIVQESTLPAEFEITAWTEDEQGKFEYIMAIKHKTLPIQGVQFHPESILSEHGHQLLKNFIEG